MNDQMLAKAVLALESIARDTADIKKALQGIAAELRKGNGPRGGVEKLTTGR